MKVTKKSVPSSNTASDQKQFDKLINHTKKIKDKYNNMDEESKKKMLLGVAGAFAVLTSIAAAKKVSKKRKNIKSRRDSKK